MKAMVLSSLGNVKANPNPLAWTDYPDPILSDGEILIRVTACGVCHTELDEIEGRMSPRLPIVLGHQVVGRVVGVQNLETLDVNGNFQYQETLRFAQGNVIEPEARVGVAWIASACGKCNPCLSGNENLCAEFKATGRDTDGGYAQYMKIHADFAHPIPKSLSDSEAAPLLCAGAIGFRALRLANIQDGAALGLMGFGGSNHLVLKMSKHKYPNAKVYVFSRNAEEREFALSLGADWAGEINGIPPEALDSVIDTTPVWGPDMEALKRLKPGGRLIINAIRKEESDKNVLLEMDYPSQLWMEKEIKSAANVTRADVREFLSLAAEANIKPEFQEYDLREANRALVELKMGKIRGAKVLKT